MNRDFFVRLVFATHRVADALPVEEQVAAEIRETANAVLADLILLGEKELIARAKKQELVPRLERQIDILIVYLGRAKEAGLAHAENFSMLEQEYRKIREFLEMFEDIQPAQQEVAKAPDASVLAQRESPVNPPPAKETREKARVPATKTRGEELTGRQQKILEFLKTKENVQVWELQKVLPEVTKRTLRRDLDALLLKNLVERKGEWNAVFYELK